MDHTAAFYSRPSSHVGGGGFNVFAGSRRQRGGSIFGKLKNFFLPVAKNLGKSLFSHGIGLANDVARDAMEGKSIKKSLMNRGKSRALDFGKTALREGIGSLSNMIGKGGRRAPRKKRKAKIRKTIRRRKPVRKRKNKPRQRRRPISSKTVSRKRRKSVKATRHNAKRRRIATNF